MRRNSNEMSTGMAIILTLGILIFIGWIMSLGTPKCIKSGCDHDAKEGSNYCWLHDYSTYSYKSYGTSSSGSSTTGSSTYSSGGSTTGNRTYSSGSNSTRNTNRSTNSYDDGYNDVYEDDDYDWDRYRSDSDYGVMRKNSDVQQHQMQRGCHMLKLSLKQYMSG